jgi:hypothetical protein
VPVPPRSASSRTNPVGPRAPRASCCGQRCAPSPGDTPVWVRELPLRPLWLRVKTGGAGILFTGARLNYQRKRMAV